MPNCRPGSSDSLEVTQDGWTTFQTLPGPDASCGAKLYTHRSSKPLLLRNGLLALRGQYLYYTPLDRVYWQCLQQGVSQILVTPDGKHLWITTLKKELLRYQDPTITPLSFALPPQFMAQKMVWKNQSLYVFSSEHRLFYGNENGFQLRTLVQAGSTLHASIQCPAGEAIYGAYQHAVLLSQDSGQSWKRIAFAPWPIQDLRVTDAGKLELWHGVNHPVLLQMDLSSYAFERHQGTSPIHEFNIDSLVAVTVYSLQLNRRRAKKSMIRYATTEGGALFPEFSEAYENGTAMDLDSIPPLPLGSLQELLRAMQREPHWRPQAVDFQITAADVDHFRTAVAQLQRSPFSQASIDEEQRRYLLSMPDSFYTASPVRLSNAVRMGKYLKERLGNWQLKVTFSDASGENLTFTCVYFQQAPYLLPWQVEANHHHNMS
ncbi:MAG: hypothetical protein ACFB10_21195, partial [Salibacteraceae bacterium]